MTAAGASQDSGQHSPRIFIMMGVSGSGKTTIGSLLAKRLAKATFLDADDFHPQANKDKMHAGQPLTDADRWPWLAVLNQQLQDRFHRGESCVLACSALKAAYRDKLQEGLPQGAVCFVMLNGSHDLIAQRLAARHHAYMNSSLLDSQFATLEVPKNAVTVTNEGTPDEVVAEILQKTGLAEDATAHQPVQGEASGAGVAVQTTK